MYVSDCFLKLLFRQIKNLTTEKFGSDAKVFNFFCIAFFFTNFYVLKKKLFTVVIQFLFVIILEN